MLLDLFLPFGQLCPLRACGAVQRVGDHGKLGAVTLLHLVNIFCAHPGEKVAPIAVHVNKRLKAVLFAAVEKPVNWTFLVYLTMVVEEVFQEIFADDLSRHSCASDSIRDEFQVFFQLLASIDRLNPFYKARCDVSV